MLPKTVSPRTVWTAAWIAAIPVSILLFLPLIPVERMVMRLLGLPEDPVGGLLFWLLFCFGCTLTCFLIGKGLPYLGIQVRRRSVERFTPDDRAFEEAAVALPIEIGPHRWIIWGTSGAFFFLGLGAIVLVVWFPPPNGDRVAALFLGLVVWLIGLVATRAAPDTICEISEAGIRARAGFWGTLAFVPWEELARCEIIHDDADGACDYFQLWDRAGHCRFNARSWIHMVSSADRTRIFRVLRSKFPSKAKVESKEESGLLQPASGLWDRELDG